MIKSLTLGLSGLTAVVVLALSGCATSGEQARTAACTNCGKITNISKEQVPGDSLVGLDALDTASGAGVPILSGPSLPDPLGGTASRATRPAGSFTRPPVLVDVVDLRMDDGSAQRVVVRSASRFRVGDRVRVVGDQLLPAPDAAGR